MVTREQMTEMYSFIQTATRELTQEEIDLITDVEETFRMTEIDILVEIYNELYQTRIWNCNCDEMHHDVIQKLSIQKQYQLLKWEE